MTDDLLHDSLDMLHERREISVQRLLDDVLTTLDEVIAALGDVRLVTKCQNLRYMLAHVVIEGSGDAEHA